MKRSAKGDVRAINEPLAGDEPQARESFGQTINGHACLELVQAGAEAVMAAPAARNNGARVTHAITT